MTPPPVALVSAFLIFTTTLINATVYENAEDNSIARWNITDNIPSGATINNIYDNTLQSRVIELNGSSYNNAYTIGNEPQENGAWNDTQNFYFKWSIKNSEGFLIDVLLNTQNGLRYLRYSDNDNDLGIESGYIINQGVGFNSANGQWHNLFRNLQNDINEFEPNNQIISVNGLTIRGNCKIDNIELVNKPIIDKDFTLYEDAEDASISRWTISDTILGDGRIKNIINDSNTTRIIELNSSNNYSNEYQLNLNHNQNNFNIQWDMKTYEGFIVDILVSTSAGERYLEYTDIEITNKGKEGDTIYHGLGYYPTNGNWNRFKRDLKKDLKEFEPNNNIISVDNFFIRANCKIDNIELYSTPITIYEDAEDNSTDRWSIYSGSVDANISNIYDNNLTSNIISLNGNSYGNQYIIGGDYINEADAWHNTKHSNLQFTIQNSEGFILSLVTNTTNGMRYINYTDANITLYGKDGDTLFYGLGKSASNNKWHTYIRDIALDIKRVEQNNTLLSIEGLIVTGNIKIDNLQLFSILHPTSNKAGVTLTFDDTTVNSWFNMNNTFLKYGAKATFFISHFFSLDTLKINKLKTLQSNGSEIGCHSYNHKGVKTDYNSDIGRIDEYLNEQIIPAINLMQDSGFNPVSFAYPYGEHEKHYDNAVRAYFPYIRLTFDDFESKLYQQREIYHTSLLKYNLLSGAGIDSDFENSINEIENSLIKARKNGEIVIFYAHDIVNDANQSYNILPQTLEKVLEISRNLGLKFYTYKEAYQVGNGQ